MKTFEARYSPASEIREAPYMTCQSPPRSWSGVSGWSAIIWILVGTSSASVTPWAVIARQTATGSNDGTITWVDPRS